MRRLPAIIVTLFVLACLLIFAVGQDTPTETLTTQAPVVIPLRPPEIVQVVRLQMALEAYVQGLYATHGISRDQYVLDLNNGVFVPREQK